MKKIEPKIIIVKECWRCPYHKQVWDDPRFSHYCTWQSYSKETDRKIESETAWRTLPDFCPLDNLETVMKLYGIHGNGGF